MALSESDLTTIDPLPCHSTPEKSQPWPFLSSEFFHPSRATESSSTPRESITRANGPGGSDTAGGGCTTKTGPSTKASGLKTSPAVKECSAVVSVQLGCVDGLILNRM